MQVHDIMTPSVHIADPNALADVSRAEDECAQEALRDISAPA